MLVQNNFFLTHLKLVSIIFLFLFLFLFLSTVYNKWHKPRTAVQSIGTQTKYIYGRKVKWPAKNCKGPSVVKPSKNPLPKGSGNFFRTNFSPHRICQRGRPALSYRKASC